MALAFSIAVLLSIAAGVAVVARRLEAPYALLLVVAGLALGPLHWITPPPLSQRVLYTIFLPGLLFEAAYHLKLDELRRGAIRITALAVPGVVVGMIVTGALVFAAGRVGIATPVALPTALVFAAIVAATDPIAVVAVFRELGTARALRVLVEGESLLNDGTAIVLVTIALAMIDGTVSYVGAALLFGRIVVVGVGVGVVFGLVASLVLRRVAVRVVAVAVTIAVAYGAFAAAERIHGSGVLATVTAGLLAGHHALKLAPHSRRRAALRAFWERAAFVLNALVFLLVGFVVDLRALGEHARLVAVAYLASLVARGVIVYGVSVLLQRTRERVPWSWSAVLTWGGLRGALSLVLAFALPEDFPNRGAVEAMTSGVVIISLLLQGVTMGPLLRRLRVGDARG